MKAIHRSRNCIVVVIAMLLGCGGAGAGVGGSGSTGLITLESVLFEDVRASNECLDANETVYCPGLPGDFPPPEVEIPISAAPPVPDICRTCEGSEVLLYLFDSRGLEPTTSCSVATRIDSDDWRLSEPEAGGAVGGFEVVAPEEDVEGAEQIDTAVVCFENPEGLSLPPSIETLADLEPTFVFVGPDLAGAV